MPNAVVIDDADIAVWLLYFLEARGAVVTLSDTQNVHVDLNPMVDLDAPKVARLAPMITKLMPHIRTLLQARPTTRGTVQ